MKKDQPTEEKYALDSSGRKNSGSDSGLPGKKKNQHFPIIGLGASAGGLEALKSFFSKVPPDSGMAYIVLVHMSPRQPTMMHELLGNVTRATVQTAKDNTAIQPHNVYVVPSDKEIRINEGKILLIDPVDKKYHLPIDLFFRSLAADQGSRAAAVILSGTGSDGTLGLKDIKSSEGLVVAQSEDTARYAGMPRSAINTSQVDMILPPGDMPEKLRQYFDHNFSIQEKTKDTETEKMDWLNKIYNLLKIHLGHNFSYYKKSTILRRIDRRMGVNQIRDHDEYVRYLRDNPKELQCLFHELLIGVTNFFRDPKSYEALKGDVLPKIIQDMNDGDMFRVWVPGCSSGEEAYSLAMVLLESLDKTSRRVSLQLFGTDIDSRAIDKARQGLYPSNIRTDVSQERLNRFFYKESEHYYRIRKEVRELVIFSVQDVLKDPPFSHLNLLSCRNLLIYLNSEAQKKLLPLFHYTLRPGGILMLGSSETVGGFTSLFQTVNTTWKIFRRKDVPNSKMKPMTFPTGIPREPSYLREKTKQQQPVRENLEPLAHKAIVDRFAPPSVLVDNSGNILHVAGRTGRYLETPSGPPSNNILDMAREGLRIELSSALRLAKTRKEHVVLNKVKVRVNGARQLIKLHVFPLDKPMELSGRFLVAFEDLKEAETVEDPDDNGKASFSWRELRISELEQELMHTRESHQSTIEELESSNEELKSTNEELQSSNEELQSTNEEMESTKEEQQSLNEELQTVNAELQSKVDELSVAQDDMNNLLNNTQIATIFVDGDLRIKRFSKEAAKIINLIGSDVGRPLEDQNTKLKYKHMIRDVQTVLNELSPVEKEVQCADGTWYRMSIKPYRTMDHKIQGAVLTFENVDAQKKCLEKLQTLNPEYQASRMLVREVFNMNTSPMAVLDERGGMVIASTAFSRLVSPDKDNIEGLNFVGQTPEKLRNTDFQALLQTALDKGEDFETRGFEMTSNYEQKTYHIKGRVIRLENNQPYRILLSFIQRSQETEVG